MDMLRFLGFATASRSANVQIFDLHSHMHAVVSQFEAAFCLSNFPASPQLSILAVLN